MTNDYKSVWRDWFDSNPLGRSQLWVEGSIPSSLTSYKLLQLNEKKACLLVKKFVYCSIVVKGLVNLSSL